MSVGRAVAGKAALRIALWVGALRPAFAQAADCAVTGKAVPPIFSCTCLSTPLLH